MLSVIADYARISVYHAHMLQTDFMNYIFKPYLWYARHYNYVYLAIWKLQVWMDIVPLTEASDASDAESSLPRIPLLQFLRNLGVCLLRYFNLTTNCVAQSWNLLHAFPRNRYVVAYQCPDWALIASVIVSSYLYYHARGYPISSASHSCKLVTYTLQSCYVLNHKPTVEKHSTGEEFSIH